MLQGSLLDCLTSDSAPPTAALAGVMPSIRAAMARAAKAYPEGRKSLPDAVSEVAQRENVPLTPKGGKTVSLEQLHKWLQPSEREHEPGLRAILCFCLATQDFSPLEPIWKACGLTVIPAGKLPLLAYGEACDAEKKAREAKRRLEARL
jgi:hypothetical protein